jgi:hypothetical protein
MQCRRCGREAFTGKVTLDKDEQIFICWKCSEKEEPKEKKKLSELSDEELLDELREAVNDRKERMRLFEHKETPKPEDIFYDKKRGTIPADIPDNKEFTTAPTM